MGDGDVAVSTGLIPNDTAVADQRLAVLAVEIETIDAGIMGMHVEKGRRLAEARDLHKYNGWPGGFDGWCNDRLGYTRQHAYQLIQIYEELGEKSKQLFTLTKAALLETSRAEPDVQNLIAERVEAGEIFTAAQVRDIRRKEQDSAVQAAADRISDATAEAERLRLLVDAAATDQHTAEADRDRLAKELSDALKTRDKAVKELEALKAKEPAKADKPTKAKTKAKTPEPEPPQPDKEPAPEVTRLGRLLDLVADELNGSVNIDATLKYVSAELRHRLEH